MMLRYGVSIEVVQLTLAVYVVGCEFVSQIISI